MLSSLLLGQGVLPMAPPDLEVVFGVALDVNASVKLFFLLLVRVFLQTVLLQFVCRVLELLHAHRLLLRFFFLVRRPVGLLAVHFVNRVGVQKHPIVSDSGHDVERNPVVDVGRPHSQLLLLSMATVGVFSLALPPVLPVALVHRPFGVLRARWKVQVGWGVVVAVGVVVHI